MSVMEAMDHLRTRCRRLKDKFGVSFREQGRRAGMSQSHMFAFLKAKQFNPTLRTLTKLESAVGEIEAERLAR